VKDDEKIGTGNSSIDFKYREIRDAEYGDSAGSRWPLLSKVDHYLRSGDGVTQPFSGRSGSFDPGGTEPPRISNLGAGGEGNLTTLKIRRWPE
jgi:hypothetical protein